MRHRYTVVRETKPRIEFSIFQPASDTEVPKGTIRLAKASCLACNLVLSPLRVREQLRQQRGGANVIFSKTGDRIGGARLWAVVSANLDGREREYRLPTEEDYKAVFEADLALKRLITNDPGDQGNSTIPNEATPQDGTGSVGGGYRTRKYGIVEFGDLFTSRQKLGLALYGKAIAALYEGDTIETAVAELLALAVALSANVNETLTRQ